MINQKENPVSWAMLMYELDDAHEHLGDLISKMAEDGAIEDEDYRVQLGHVFAHLNRAWNGRNEVELDKTSDQIPSKRSQFPTDLKPVG